MVLGGADGDTCIQKTECPVSPGPKKRWCGGETCDGNCYNGVTFAVRIFRGRVAATPRLPRGRSVETSRGDAAAATWIFGRDRRAPQVCEEGSSLEIKGEGPHMSGASSRIFMCTTSTSTTFQSTPCK